MHQVYTGVALVKYRETLESYVFYEETRVYVYPMTNEEIQAYIDSMDGRDKAGGYGIQGPFAAYIQGIEGDYYNVMGLPIGRLYQELKRREDYGNV